MNNTKALVKLMSMIVAGAQALSSGSSATTTSAQLPNLPSMTTDSVLSTAARIGQTSPATASRIEIALVAGRSELISAVIQAVRTCKTTPHQCVVDAIAHLGGVTTRNLVSLADLSAALEAIGISPAIIAEALDAYSTVVAAAVEAGLIPEQFAALTLAGGVSGSLYL